MAGFTLPALEGISLSIGADSQGTERFFTGLIDELSLYNRALTSDEISGLYHLPVQSTCWWPTWVGDYQQGWVKNGAAVGSSRSDVLFTLGEVSGDTTEGTFFSLGYQGYLELGIDDLVRDGSLTVFETSWGGGRSPGIGVDICLERRVLGKFRRGG